MLRIIHFSDLHLCPNRRGKVLLDILDSLLEKLKEIHREAPIDAIIFSGDLINQGGYGFDKTLYECFKLFETEVIDKMVDTLQIKHEQFLFVPGNHDVDRNKIEKANRKRLKRLKSQQDVANYLTAEDADFSRIEDFLRFQKEYYETNTDCAFCDTSDQLSKTICLQFGKNKVGFTLLNSTWMCEGDKDEHNIALGISQLNQSLELLKKQKCDLYVAISHHHPEFLKETELADVTKVLHQHYDLLFCGHTHGMKSKYEQDENGSLFQSIAAGTLFGNEYEANPQYKNGFTLLEYDTTHKTVFVTPYTKDTDGTFTVDLNYGELGTWKYEIPGRRFIQHLDDWLASYPRDYRWISSGKLEDYKAQLRNPQIPRIILTALAGLGKTRLIYEAFNDGSKHRNTFYVDLSLSGENNAFAEFQEIVKTVGSNEVLFILDNCSWDNADKFYCMCHDKVRIICINNECYSRSTTGPFHVINLVADDVRQEVNLMIEQNLPLTASNNHICDEIKKIADGFPFMAYRLLDVYHSEGKFGVKDVEGIVNRLLKLDVQDGKLQRKVLTMMSLFQPFPLIKYNKKAFEFILSNNILLPLGSIMTLQDRQKVVKRTINAYDKMLLENTGSMLNVRPFPLAVYLVSEWFSELYEEDLYQLLEDFAELKEKDATCQATLVDCMARRIEYMNGDPLAAEFIDRLTESNSPFVSEKVACSDMGSRLFLSLASVNPVAVCRCLNELFPPQKTEWIKSHIVDQCRRNYVWTLEKLCFDKRTYKQAVKILATFAVAENETWANNATSIFKQLFHIMLAGTETNLEERLHTLVELHSWGKDYADLLFSALDSAFVSRGFGRNCGGEYFGTETKNEYRPSIQEVRKYWEKCRDLLLQCIKEDSEYQVKTLNILEHHGSQWIADGWFDTLFYPLTEALKSYHADFSALYEKTTRFDLKRLAKRLPKDKQTEIEEYIKGLSTDSFAIRLKETTRQFYDIGPFDIWEASMSFFEPLAKEFVDKRIYESEKELAALANKSFDVNYAFLTKVSSLLSDSELSVAFNLLFPLVVAKEDSEIIPLVSSLCYLNRNKKPTENFLQSILSEGRRELFVQYMARCEDEDLSQLKAIVALQEEGNLTVNEVALYLEAASGISPKSLKEMITTVSSRYPTLINNVVETILRFQFMLRGSDEELLKQIKSLLLQYSISEDNQRGIYDYSLFIRELLEKGNDEVFAKAMSDKLIKTLNSQYIRNGIVEIYPVILEKYPDAVWADFEKEFSKEFSPFLFQIKNEIGSGFGFGAGPLFQLGDEKIKALCKEYPTTAPVKIAVMMPVFDVRYSEADSFSAISLWVIDNFGNQENVLNEFHSNIHSFSWTGSPLPLFHQIKKCFEQLQNHPIAEVRTWSLLCIKEIDSEIKREQDSEDFRRMHFQ